MSRFTWSARGAIILAYAFAAHDAIADWPQWGGSGRRNNVSSVRGLPTDWDYGKFDHKTGRWESALARNIKRMSDLGSQTYGTPVVADGRIFVGTNNAKGYLKRYPADVDLGCLLCFREHDEAWTSLLSEREELIAAFDALKKPVFILTADLHNSFAIKITDRVWEFASGPLNSVNHVPPNDEGNRPATGFFKSGPRTCDIRWSSYILPDPERPQRMYPNYCVVQVNNVYNMPQKLGGMRWVAYPHPQVIFQYFDGRTGEFQYAETISTHREQP